MMGRSSSPQDFTPLSPVEFEILLVLAAGDSHGWGIIKEAQTRWGGELSFETGTLYRALRRLTTAGLVKPADRRPTAAGDDRRRRYFAITPLGRQVAAIEARRMETQVDAARDRALLTEGRP
jgi:DNA-binding PadR family transcriptional regulator